MTAPDDDHPAAGDDPAAPARPARARRGTFVVLTVAAVVVLAGLAVARIAPSRGETDPLDPDAPGLADYTFHTKGCSYQPDRGGLVAHFDVSTGDAGRFTVDVAAVTDEGAEDLDISTTHVVRYTVPFYGARSRKAFDVVVPLTETEHRSGYRKCRFTVNGAQ